MTALAVVIGALLGTGARLGLDAAIPHPSDGWPSSTLIINVAGSFALGLLIARVWPTAPSWLRAGLGAGAMGSFTTFSAMAVSVVELNVAGRGLVAVAYVIASVVLGLVAAWLGLRIGSATRSGARTPIGADE